MVGPRPGRSDLPARADGFPYSVAGPVTVEW